VENQIVQNFNRCTVKIDNFFTVWTASSSWLRTLEVEAIERDLKVFSSQKRGNYCFLEKFAEF
jgi:hypothetical protein